jgi:hypothetical protein
MKNAVLWHVTLYGSCENRHFGETYSFHHQSEKDQHASFFHPANEGYTLLRNVSSCKSRMVLHPRRRHSSNVNYIFFGYEELT